MMMDVSLIYCSDLSQYIEILNHYIVHLKLICHVNYKV